MSTSMWVFPLAMLAVMALVMAAGMVVLHRKASELSGGAPRGLQGALALLVNRIVMRLLRAGVPIRIFGNPVVLLTVPGRKTGQPRTTVVDLYEQGGRRFLVSTHGGDSALWVHNLRAAGKGTLARGGSREQFSAVELSADVAGEVLKEVLGPRLASPLGGLALRQTVEIAPGASLPDFIKAARSHPVFELRREGNSHG